MRTLPGESDRHAWSWIENDNLSVLGTPVFCSTFAQHQPNQLVISKNRELIEATVSFLDNFKNSNIVELGIRSGGSTALLAAVAKPRKLLAMDIDPEPIKPLEWFLNRNELRDTVHAHYGVDQADKQKLSEIVGAEFDGPIDLVIDDASHLYAPTRASFETLFPLLRGGVYLIEDWQWEHRIANSLAQDWGQGIRPVASDREPVAIDFMRVMNEKLQPKADTFSEHLAWLLAYLDSADSTTAHSSKLATGASRELRSRVPLTKLVIEILLLKASGLDCIDSVVIDKHWIAVRRGEGVISPSDWSLNADVANIFGQLP